MRREHAGPARPGAFLVFEGPEGAGKSTQADRLANRLAEEGYRALVTREPGGTPAAQRIREVILDPELRIDPLPEYLLYSAARAQHVTERISPALAEGTVVVCDRFTGSSLAYQGHGRGLDLAFVRALNERATGGLTPDVVILLDLPPDVGLRRIASRGRADRLERADLSFHERVRRGFLAEAGAADPRPWVVLDAAQEPDALAERVWQAVRPVLPARPFPSGRGTPSTGTAR